MTKHTPGPWVLDDPIHEPVVDDRYHVIDAAGGFHDGVKGAGFSVSGVMHINDAQLIVAAPDLLEALEAVVESGEIPYCYSSPLVLKAKAAIAKARGEPK